MKKKSFWKGKHGPLLIAEIGGNHEGDFSYAKKLTKLAISTGVDVVKFQVYSGSGLVSRVESKRRFEHFKKFELSKEQHIEIAKMCKKAKVIYLASVWEESSLNWIDKYLKFYKIGSGDLTAYPILSLLAKRNKPIILSTGLSTLKEIKNTIKFLRQQNKKYKKENYLALLQCTSSYPTDDREVNLNVINTLKQSTNLPVGYSHHNKGDLALITAYLMGAQILEFHFTDTRKKKFFRDHKISLNPQETKDLISKIQKINLIKGKSIKKPTHNEIKSKHIQSFRRALYLNRDLKKGQVIKKEFVTCLRPNKGIDARNYKKIIGKKLKNNVLAYEKIKLKI